MPERRDQGPLSKAGSQVWKFLLLIAAIAVALLAVKGEVLALSTVAAEQSVSPVRSRVEVIERRAERTDHNLETLRRNVYRLCLASKVRDCEP